ncbi:MAG: hypothetical protein ISS77_04130 [Phycisphaerae bacterium]|nr:hypothetical protein [Phycisphaerae bacterium]
MLKPKFKKRRNYERKEKPEKIYKRMSRDHLDVLQNIEFSIVSTCRNHEDIDDRIVASAVKTAISGSDPVGELSAILIDDLVQVRQMRGGSAPDNIWIDGLKVVLWSVRNHSDLQPGDRDYLTFIQNYVV